MVSLGFEQNTRGYYEASFVSDGDPHVVELSRSTEGSIVIYAKIGTMAKVPIKGISKYDADFNFMFKVEEPSGVEIIIESETAVTEGGYE